MKKKKNWWVIIPVKIFQVFYLVFVAVFKTVFVDLFVNIKHSWTYTFNPEEREKMKRKLEAEKLVKVVGDRLKTVERLLYSVFEDPSYTKSDKGKYDLKQLKKEVK